MKKRVTIKNCHELAAHHNGRFLSSEYLDSRTKYLWECENKHTWYGTYTLVQQGYWCRTCCKNTTEDCQILAKSKNGEFLSEKYLNNKFKYLWKCANNHKWAATSDSIKGGSWCPECAGLKKKTIEDCHNLAKSKKGFFLSNKYINNRSKYLWRCEKGHDWTSTFRDINQDHWCPFCVDNRKAQNKIYEFVKNFCPDSLQNISNLLPSKRLSFDVYIPSLKKAIELDGEYWHNRPDQIERDQRKNREAEEVGIDILRVSYKDWMKKHSEVTITILDFIQNKSNLNKDRIL